MSGETNLSAYTHTHEYIDYTQFTAKLNRQGLEAEEESRKYQVRLEEKTEKIRKAIN